MAALNFPSSPTVGQTYTANGLTYTWDGVSWDSTLTGVVFTTTDQTIAGTKTFSSTISGSVSGTSGSVANALTIGTALSGTSYNGSTAVTIALANTAVTAGSYTNASVTVDAQGRLTAASSGTDPVTSVNGTSPVVSSGGSTPAISLASGYGDTQNPYASKTANYVLAAPNGSAGVPTFRAIVAADIPTLNQNTTGSAGSVANALTIGTGLSGTSYNGSAAVTIANTGVTSLTAGTGISLSASTGGVTITNTASGATISDDTTTNATRYPLYAAATSGTASTVYVSSTKYTYNPSTGTLSATVMSASSDERLKTNWRDLSSDFVTRLADVKHGIFDRIDFKTTDVGVSAQSLQKILPQAVIADEQDFLSVNYGGAALVAAIELAKEVKALRAEIMELKAKG